MSSESDKGKIKKFFESIRRADEDVNLPPPPDRRGELKQFAYASGLMVFAGMLLSLASPELPILPAITLSIVAVGTTRFLYLGIKDNIVTNIRNVHDAWQTTRDRDERFKQVKRPKI